MAQLYYQSTILLSKLVKTIYKLWKKKGVICKYEVVSSQTIIVDITILGKGKNLWNANVISLENIVK